MSCSSPKEVRGVVVSCKKCPECSRFKAWLFTARCAAEISVAERTWFVTFTLRREMSDRIGYRLVQRFLKRLRAGTKMRLRYACVAEFGAKGGRLHYHLLVHGPAALTERLIRSKWRGGISEATLIRRSSPSAAAGASSAWYLSKAARYLTKQSGRVRFSQAYGSSALKVVLSHVLPSLPPDWLAAMYVGDMPLGICGVRIPRRYALSFLPPYDFSPGREILLECGSSSPARNVRRSLIPLK
nr:MAG: replication initiator protein [Microvirus sp.]